MLKTITNSTALVRRNPNQLKVLYQSVRTLNNSTTPGAPKPSPQTESQNLPSLNLWTTIREARPAVRWTVYGGLGIMATVECTFWFNVLRAKFFPSASQKEKDKAEEFLERIRGAVKGYRKVWLTNYHRYYGAHLWGLGYGGLDGLDPELRK